MAEQWREKEPIRRFAAFLRAEGLLSAEREAEIAAEAKRVMDRAVVEMERTAVPGPEILFETTYASGTPWPLEEGLAEFQA